MLQKLLFFGMLVVCVSCDFFSVKNQKTQIDTMEVITSFEAEVPIEIPNNLLDRMKVREEISVFVTAIDTLQIATSFQTEKENRTIFVPSNKALASYKANSEMLQIVTNHTVRESMNTIFLTQNIRSHGGSYSVETLSGKTLVAYKVGTDLYLKDILGNTAKISKSDIVATNGLIHIVDGLLYP